MVAETKKRLILLAKVLVFVEVLAIAGATGILIGGSTARTSDAKTLVATAPEARLGQVVLKVFVAPSGATLTVDGRQIDAPVGEHGVYVQVAAKTQVRLRASKEGFVALDRVVTSPANGVSVETMTLAARAPKAETPGGDATAAPLDTSRRIDESTRVVRRSRTKTSSKRARGRSAPKTGALVVEYAPRDAKVTVDRKLVRGSSPVTLDDLAPGTHRIDVRSSGHRPMRRSVKVNAGEQVHVSFILSKEPEVEASVTPSGAVARMTAPSSSPSALAAARRTGGSPDARGANVSSDARRTDPSDARRTGVSLDARRTSPSDARRAGASPDARETGAAKDTSPNAGRTSESVPTSNPSVGRVTLLHRALASLAEGRDQFRIAVVHAPGRANSASIRALQADARRPGIALRLKLTPFRSVSDLTKAMDRGKFDALFIDPSVMRATTSILQVSRARKVISLATGRDLVRSGASVGLVRGEGGVIERLYLNRRALRVECCRPPAALRRMVTAVD